ncbi:Glycosyltransferase family 28, N-terminal domain [Phytophthora cactorum]|nr:Glycosyltransferase family 28, N-terminal domain [Phytophthora cactorum]
MVAQTWSFGDSNQYFKSLFWRLESSPHDSPIIRKPTQSNNSSWPVLFERLQQLDQLFQAWHEQLRSLFTWQQREQMRSVDTTELSDGYSSCEEGPGEHSTLRRRSSKPRPRSKTLSDCSLEVNSSRKPIADQNHVKDSQASAVRPPAMQICIMIVGTRGDVQPFLAIAKRLQQDGHRVRLATHKIYRDFITNHGVEFYPLGGDPKELAAYMKDVPRQMQILEDILMSTWPAVSAPDPDGKAPGVPGSPFRAQAIISNPVTYGHIHVAEKLGVPLHIMFPQPWVPTVAFPHPMSNLPYQDKPQKRNYLSYKLVDLLMWETTERIVNTFRKMLLDLDIPHSFMWSPSLVPKPFDWGDLYDIVGTVTLKTEDSSYTASPELEAFVGNDGGPIFVGFGSMVLEDPRATTKMIIEAAKQANVRVLIQSSWTDMTGDIEIPTTSSSLEIALMIGFCHVALQSCTMEALALQLEATFIVSFFGDQPFWGRAVVKAGVGVDPCPINELTTKKLRAAFEELQKAPERMQTEDGAEEAVKTSTTFATASDAMRSRPRSDGDQFCERCNSKTDRKDVIEYRSVDYAARGQELTNITRFTCGSSPPVGWAIACLNHIGGVVRDISQFLLFSCFTSWDVVPESATLAIAPPPADVRTAGIAVHGPDGRIRLDVAEEEEIDLDALRRRSRSTIDEEEDLRLEEATRNTHQRRAAIPGIAQRLQKDGHRVRLATHAIYRDFVTSYGVEFYPLGGDPKELAAYMVKTGGHLIPTKVETIQKDVPRNLQMIDEILHSTWPAVSAADPEGGGPGAIISNPVTYGHIHVAERLGVPLHIMFPQPWVPTTAFPHPLANMPYTGKPQKRNYLSYKLVDLLMWQGTEGIVNEFRTEVLGLRKIRKGDGGRDILLTYTFLTLYPKDWGDLYDVVGTVVLKGTASSYTPTPELEAFLGTDEGPIFVGFGSMVLEDPKATTKMIIEAARQANVRVLIQSSWSDMAGDLTIPDNIFFLGNCPHDWLMPRVSAVVHHGGAGTTAAVYWPPFWGWAVQRAGVGVTPCPIEELTTEKLRVAFEGLQSLKMRSRAVEIQQKMQQEDGAEEAVRCFYRHLPLRACAAIWITLDVDFVIASQPENFERKVVDYHFVDYTARGPAHGFAGASAGAAAFFHELGGFREEGPKGAVIGVVKAGHANYFNETGRRKRGSVFDKTFMAALGKENGLIDSYTSGGSTEEIETHRCIGPKKEVRRKVELTVSEEDKIKYQARFREIMSEKENHRESLDRIDRNSSASSITSDAESESSPRGGISIISADFTATGNIGVKFNVGTKTPDAISESKIEEWRQYSKLQKVKSERILKIFEGTTVPPMNICLATIANEEFRADIVARGLDSTAGWCSEELPDFIKYLHETKNANVIQKHKAGRPVLGPFKDLVEGADPHGRGHNIPGEHFRADALFWHPLLFGHVHVAERLGIPLQCFSLCVLMDDISQLGREFKKTNWLSYGVVDTVLWRGMENILNDFREHIGLRGHCNQPSPLVEWRIPHVYLWNPTLLQRPVDWGRELSVAGYVTLKDEREMEKMRKFKWSRSLNDFTLETCNPVIYFGIDRLLRQIDEAAEQANVKILFQAREGRSNHSLYHSENIYEVESNFPYSLILRKPAIVEEGLAAGKPVGICVSVSSQYYAACMCVTAGVGIPPIDLKTVRSSRRDFYLNLPLRAMRCDIDEDKIARIYDPRLELKLSFDAYIAIQPLRTHDDTDDVSYKPLWYDGRRPAKFMLRDIAGDQEPLDQKPIHGLESIRKALTSFASHESTDSHLKRLDPSCRD